MSPVEPCPKIKKTFFDPQTQKRASYIRMSAPPCGVLTLPSLVPRCAELCCVGHNPMGSGNIRPCLGSAFQRFRVQLRATALRKLETTRPLPCLAQEQCLFEAWLCWIGLFGRLGFLSRGLLYKECAHHTRTPFSKGSTQPRVASPSKTAALCGQFLWPARLAGLGCGHGLH